MKQTVAMGEQKPRVLRRDWSNNHLVSDSDRAFLVHLMEWKNHPGHIVIMTVTLLLVTAYSTVIHNAYGGSTSTFGYFKPLMRRPHDENAFSCVPLGIHLAPHSDVDDNFSVSMTVSFYLPFLPCKYARPAVSYGRKGKESESTLAIVPDPLHLKYASRKTESKTFLSDWVYHVEMPKLKAGEQEHWYRIDIHEDVAKHVEKQTSSVPSRAIQQPNIVVGSTHYFRTPPLLGSPTSIAIVADLGDTAISHRTIQGMEEASSEVSKIPASLAVVAGDISYANGRPYLWSQWFRHSESLFQHLPLSVSVGNHEIEVSTSHGILFE